MYPLLATIDSPQDLKKLSAAQLPQVASELRRYLIEHILDVGGHFASGLGVVELTVALHYVFSAPEDSIIFDVGHQAYPHKILTGRRDRLPSIRKLNGLAPFPSRHESEYDVLSVGHSSTSISAAIGIEMAQKLQNKNRQVIAVIGDGAMTAGMAFEALNHAGDIKSNILVILNDNEMSISPNVGAINSLLTRTLSNPFLQGLRTEGKGILSHLPSPVFNMARKAEEHVKGLVAGGTLFEEFGFQYFGPIDGHDLDMLTNTLENLKYQKGPKFLHILTKKGKGYQHAEESPVSYHAVNAKFHRQTEPANSSDTAQLQSENKAKTYTQVFSDWICASAKTNPKIAAITPAMREGSGLVEFSKQYPERYFDVGIAEQHAVTLSAGLAIGGMKPVVAIYSSFLQRAYDQVIHDVALQNLPVIFAVDRAGIVGPDGATHAGSFDLSFMRCIPNLVIMAPSNEQECHYMLNTALGLNQPSVVRYPRGKGVGIVADKSDTTTLELGKANVIREGENLVIIGIGAMCELAKALGDKFNATVLDWRFVKPFDTELLAKLALTHTHFVSIEDNAIAGGAGSAISEWFNTQNLSIKMRNLGLKDEYLPHGERSEILDLAGLNFADLQSEIASFISHKN